MVLFLELQYDGHTFPGLLTNIGGAGLLCRSMCCKNVGDGDVEVDVQDNVNIWELLLWDVACPRGGTEALRALEQLMLLRMVVYFVSEPSVLLQMKVLDLIVLALGQGMVI